MVKKNNHVDLCVVAFLGRVLCVVNQRVQGYERATQIVKSWRRNELLMEAPESKRLGVTEVELKVNNALSVNL